MPRGGRRHGPREVREPARPASPPPRDRRVALALRWLTDYARERSDRTMAEKFASELIDAFRSTGNAVKKREDTHKMAEANKAFAHYRW